MQEGLSEAQAAAERLPRAEAAAKVGTAVGRGYLWNLLNFGVSQGASTLIFVVLSYALTPATFGVFALAAILVDLFGEWGRWSSIDAIVQRRNYSTVALSSAFFSLLGVAVVLTGILVIAAGQAASLLEEPTVASILPSLAVTLLLIPGAAVMEAIVLRQLNFRAQAIRSMIGTIAGGVFGLSVAFSPAFEWALVAQRLAHSVATLGALFAFTRWLPTREFDLDLARDFLARAGKLWIATVLATMHNRVTQAAVGLRGGAEALGLLIVAQRFETALHGPLTGPVQGLWLPALSALRSDKAESWRLYLRLSQLMALLAVPAFVGLGLVGRDLAAVVLDARYHLVGEILLVICLRGLTVPVGYFSNLIFAGLDRTDLSLKLSIAQLCLMVPAVWVAASFGPVWAVAVAVILAAITDVIATGIQVRMLGGRISELATALMPAYLSGLAMVSVILSLGWMLEFQPSLYRLICLVGAGGATYLGWMVIFHRQEVMGAWRLMAPGR